MDKKLKTKWVKALMSGRFRQTVGQLHDGGGYCCLGVLHYVATGKIPPQMWDGDVPACIRKMGNEIQTEFALLNDDGVPFEVIAGLINEAL